MAPKRSRGCRSHSPHREPYCSASIPDARELALNANASTLGTPPDFNIDVAVLNIGMPTADHFSAQLHRRNQALGGTRHTKALDK